MIQDIPLSSNFKRWQHTCVSPLLVALTYADDLRFNPDVFSLLPTGKNLDSDSKVLNNSVTL